MKKFNKLFSLIKKINPYKFIFGIVIVCVIGGVVFLIDVNNKLKISNENLTIMNNDLSVELNNKKKEIEQKDSKINDINNQLSDCKNLLLENESMISDLNQQLESAKLRINELENTVDELNSEIEKKNNTFLGSFKITFYTPTDGSCTGITATGTIATPYRTVAVDPNVIPLGTRLYVEGLGEVVAEDTGGAIKGNILDFCVATKSEAYSHGIKYLNVWILK